jgi:hypothetical protein
VNDSHGGILVRDRGFALLGESEHEERRRMRRTGFGMGRIGERLRQRGERQRGIRGCQPRKRRRGPPPAAAHVRERGSRGDEG